MKLHTHQIFVILVSVCAIHENFAGKIKRERTTSSASHPYTKTPKYTQGQYLARQLRANIEFGRNLDMLIEKAETNIHNLEWAAIMFGQRTEKFDQLLENNKVNKEMLQKMKKTNDAHIQKLEAEAMKEISDDISDLRVTDQSQK